MWKIRTLLTMVFLIAGAAAEVAFVPTISFAQSSAHTATGKAAATPTDVSKWTRGKWNAAKARWATEKEKWDTCNKEAKNKKLRSRKRWSSIYDCMTS